MLIRLTFLLLLSFPLVVQGATTHQETASNSSATVAASGTLTVTMAGAATDGELLVAFCHRDSATDTTESATTPPAGWTTATNLNTSTTAGRDRVMDVFYKIASSEGTTYAFTNNGDATEEMQCVVLVYSEVNGTQLDLSPTTSHRTTAENAAPNPPSITTATNNALVIAIGSLSGTITTPTRTCSITGYTVRHGTTDPVDNAYICIGDKVVATAGAEDPPAFTVTNIGGTDDNYSAVLAPSANSVLFYVR